MTADQANEAPSRERMEAVLRFLADEGHITAMGARQIMSLYPEAWPSGPSENLRSRDG
jgi:hypothetical protein